MRPPPSSPLFPYTTLFRSRLPTEAEWETAAAAVPPPEEGPDVLTHPRPCPGGSGLKQLDPPGQDRKSTRLNSSHSQISYAVFCLKKKKKKSKTQKRVRVTN